MLETAVWFQLMVERVCSASEEGMSVHIKGSGLPYIGNRGDTKVGLFDESQCRRYIYHDEAVH